MRDNWITLVDASRARIFSLNQKGDEMRELYDLSHPESRLHPGDLRTGGEGVVIAKKGRSMRSMEPPVERSHKESENFAKEIAVFLRNHRMVNDFDNLMLVAEPRMLGNLRDKMDSATAKRVTVTIDKNLTQHSPDEIRELVLSESSAGHGFARSH